MSVSLLKILCRYEYDPLDRLTSVGLVDHDSTQRFYQADHLTTELGQQTQRTIIRHESQPLAQQQSAAGVTEATLLATDQAHSVLQTLAQTNPQQLAYTAYGHHPVKGGLTRLIGFNGECPEAITGHYLLGRGNRAFNPVLMRFNSPDDLSPFGEGGINCYAYCQGDPINFKDPTGKMRVKFLPRKIIRKKLGSIQRPENKTTQVSAASINRHTQANSSLSETIPAVAEPEPKLKQFFNLPPTTRPENPDILSQVELDLIGTAFKYDELVSTPGFKTFASMELIELLAANKKQAAGAMNRTAKELIDEKSRGVLLQIKETSVKYHEAQAANKQIRQ